VINIINYGSGNVRAIGNIYDQLNIPYNIAFTPNEIKDCTHIILPGVGSFDQTMKTLRNSGFINPLNDLVLEKKIPVLGICVGMQILSNGSDEGVMEGLGWIKGKVKIFDKNNILEKPKLPHLGWNSIEIKKESKLFKNVDIEEGFYFIHSYYFECENKVDILTSTIYGGEFSSSVNNENIFGTQFHPEKSHSNGINVLRNFIEI
jgi:glutamine amidotransferase